MPPEDGDSPGEHHLSIKQALKKSEERFRRVVESTPNLPVMIRANGVIELVNARAECDLAIRERGLWGGLLTAGCPHGFAVIVRDCGIHSSVIRSRDRWVPDAAPTVSEMTVVCSRRRSASIRSWPKGGQGPLRHCRRHRVQGKEDGIGIPRLYC